MHQVAERLLVKVFISSCVSPKITSPNSPEIKIPLQFIPPQANLSVSQPTNLFSPNTSSSSSFPLCSRKSASETDTIYCPFPDLDSLVSGASFYFSSVCFVGLMSISSTRDWAYPCSTTPDTTLYALDRYTLFYSRFTG